MNVNKHVVLLTSNIFGRGFDSRRLHHFPAYKSSSYFYVSPQNAAELCGAHLFDDHHSNLCVSPQWRMVRLWVRYRSLRSWGLRWFSSVVVGVGRL